MTKELQDLTWSVLPKEFKDEVKELYEEFYNEKPHSDCSYGYLGLLIKLFGLHNLTSDAEGEEMLMVSRKKVQEMYAFNEDILFLDSTHRGAILLKAKLRQLYGSKCLLDEGHPKQKDCDNPLADKEGCKWRNDGKCTFDSACYYEPLNPQEPKPTEPTETFTDDCNSQSKTTSMSTLSPRNVEYLHIASKESHYRNLSQETANCDKQFDAIIKDGFAKERRLNIAAMIEPALISNPDLWKRCGNFYAGPGKNTAHSFAELALEYADALISKADKGKDK